MVLSKEEIIAELTKQGGLIETKSQLWLTHSKRFTDDELRIIAERGSLTIRDFVATEIRLNSTRHNEQNYQLLQEIQKSID